MATVSTVAASPTVVGQVAIFTATIAIAAPGAGAPTGTVQFIVDGSFFGNPVSVALSAGSSAATLSTSVLAAGTHTVTASYSGDAGFVGSTGSLSGGQTVNSKPGGDVTAALDPRTGALSITGDTGADAITISTASPGVLQVAGVGTTVNQSSGPATFSSVKSISVSLLNGNGSVTITSVSVSGNIAIVAGSGSDSITLDTITAGGVAVSTAGPAKDTISLSNLKTPTATVSTGDNAVFALSGAISADLMKLVAGGNATVNVNGVSALDDLEIAIGDNAQLVAIKSSSVRQLNILQTGATGSTVFDLENDMIRYNLTLTGGDGNDKVLLSHLDIGFKLLVLLGAGSNMVTADHITAFFGGIDGGPGGNNHYIDNGDNYGFSVSHFLGH